MHGRIENTLSKKDFRTVGKLLPRLGKALLSKRIILIGEQRDLYKRTIWNAYLRILEEEKRKALDRQRFRKAMELTERQAKIAGKFMLDAVPMLLDEASRHARMAKDETKADNF